MVLFNSENSPHIDTPANMMLAGQPVTGSQEPQQRVGQNSHAEAELDRVIVELGNASVRAANEGDMAHARELSDRMYAAIKSRTPEHQARLWRELDEMTLGGIWAQELARRNG